MTKTYSISELREMWDAKNKATRKTQNETKEHELQVRCVQWFAMAFPDHEPFFWYPPNGGYRSRKTAIAMKMEGQKRGVPDLQLAYPAKGYHGLFIEMKKAETGKRGKLVKKGRTSEYQESRMQALRDIGYRCEVCYTETQFKEIINSYLL